MKKIKHSLIIIFTFVSLSANAQLMKIIEDLDKQDQICLHSGEYMFKCSKIRHSQMDSMLNVVYKKLQDTLDDQQKLDLKNEEIAWLAKRNKYFDEEVRKKSNSVGWCIDPEMIAYYNKAEFIRDRVIELIKRIEK